MSVKTRDRPSSPTSTTTDRTGFLSKKNQDLFPPNEFYREGSLQRPYSFAPQGVPEESERSFQTGEGSKNNYNRQQKTFTQPQQPQAFRQPLREVLSQQRPPQPQSEAYHPQMAQLFLQQDTLPQEVMFLLAEEDNHIGKFRSRVEKEKQRIEKDVDLARTEIVNLLEDLKIQMCTYVDDHYKRYISVYAAFKEEIIQFKQQKLQVPLHLTPPPQKDLSTASNQNLIRELEEIQYKNQIAKLNTYVSEINKARAMRISDISKDLLQLTSSASQLYNSENSSRQLGQLKNEITKQLVQRFAQMSDFVQPLDYLLNRDQSRVIIEEDSRQRMNDYDMHNQSNNYQKQNQTQNQIHGPHGPSLNQFSQQLSPPGNFPQLSPIYGQPMLATFQSGQNTTEPRKFSAPFMLDPVVHQQVYAQPPQTVYSQAFNSGQVNPQRSSPIHQSLPQNQYQATSVSTPAPAQITIQNQNIQLKEIQRIPLNHRQMPLCFVQIDGLWASGSRDGVIKIWEGSKCVSELNGHTGAVCCLTVLRQNGVPIYLVSGSDTVENSIILWNLQTLQLERVLRGHTAAVVALLSLDDGQTVISGSYDKSIMIWSAEGGDTLSFSNTHSNAITCLGQTKGYFVSGGLDGVINVWKLKFNMAGIFESTYLEKSIKNGSIVCAIVCQGEQILSGGKDGKVRIFNTNGDLMKQFSVCGGPIVEMLMASGNLVSMSSKDKNLILSNLQNGEIQSLDTQDSVSVEFGCGVYPKMVLQRDVLQLLNQADGSLHMFRLL